MSRRPSRSILGLLLLAALSAGVGRAQTFYFSDGRKAAFPEARVKGDAIVIPLKLSDSDGGSAEISLPIASLSRIDWPAPPELAAAQAALDAGRAEDAVKSINAVLGSQEPFREVPGSWWSQGAIIKAVALAKLGREAEADAMLARMRKAKSPAEDIASGEIAIAVHLFETGKSDDANERLQKIQDAATDDDNLAAIALLKARMLEQAGKTEEALLSYLRVPVFCPTAESSLPPALLGAVRALRKLGDDTRAAALVETLTRRFPNSPEASQARR